MTDPVHLLAMIHTEGRRRVGVADLGCVVDRRLASRFVAHHKGRANDVVDVSDLAPRLGLEEQPLVVEFFHRASLSDVGRSAGTDLPVINLPLRPGVLERFASLMEMFPTPASSDAPPARKDPVDQMVDPAILRKEHHDVVSLRDASYPLCRSLVEYWNPHPSDIDVYLEETRSLEAALIRRLDLPGPTTPYHDNAFWLIANAGMLAGSEASLRRMFVMGSTLIERFWTSNERRCLVARRQRAADVLKAKPGAHVPTGTWATMDADQLEYARAREACRFRFDGAITGIYFEVDAEVLTVNAQLLPTWIGHEMVGAVMLGDDMPDACLHGPTPYIRQTS